MKSVSVLLTNADDAQERSLRTDISGKQVLHATGTSTGCEVLPVMTSLEVFRKFIKYNVDSGSVDVTQVFSRECFELWLATRPDRHRSSRQDLSKSFGLFRRALIAHISGTDGRDPFQPIEEKPFLDLIRAPEPWPWIKTLSIKLKTEKVFRLKGFHEKLQDDSKPSTNEGRPITLKRQSHIHDSPEQVKHRRASDDPALLKDVGHISSNSSPSISASCTSSSSSTSPSSPVASLHQPAPLLPSALQLLDLHSPARDFFGVGNVEPSQFSSYFSMPVYCGIVPDETKEQFKLQLSEDAVSLAQTTADMRKHHLWKRMSLLSIGILVLPTREEATRLMMTWSAKEPDRSVLILDLTASSLDNVILARNQLSFDIFGEMEVVNGSRRTRLHPSGRMPFAQAVSAAYLYVGHEVHIERTLCFAKDGKIVVCNVKLLVDPQELVLIERVKVDGFL